MRRRKDAVVVQLLQGLSAPQIAPHTRFAAVTGSPAGPLNLERRGPSRIRPDLEALRDALGRLDNPEQHFPSLLVVGTNGKGSTAAMVAAILEAHGCRTGLYTSPHLVNVAERIRVDGRMLSPSRFSALLGRLDAFPELTYFETLTAAAFLAFAEARVDCAVLEAGVGGRWDATRLAGSTIAGMTNVGTDHRQWLGNSREEIAREKGSALAAARHAVFGPGVDSALLPHLAAPQAVPGVSLVRVTEAEHGAVQARWDHTTTTLPLPLAGAHQIHNLTLALALVRIAERTGIIASVDEAAVREGLAGMRWPGRLSQHTIRGRRVVLDGAHNLEGTEALARHLARRAAPPNLLFSCLADKPVEAMARALAPHVGAVAVCSLDDERAMPVERMAAAFEGATVALSPQQALARLRDPVIAAGSLRLVGSLLEHAEGFEPW